MTAVHHFTKRRLHKCQLIPAKLSCLHSPNWIYSQLCNWVNWKWEGHKHLNHASLFGKLANYLFKHVCSYLHCLNRESVLRAGVPIKRALPPLRTSLGRVHVLSSFMLSLKTLNLVWFNTICVLCELTFAHFFVLSYVHLFVEGGTALRTEKRTQQQAIKKLNIPLMTFSTSRVQRNRILTNLLSY